MIETSTPLSVHPLTINDLAIDDLTTHDPTTTTDDPGPDDPGPWRRPPSPVALVPSTASPEPDPSPGEDPLGSQTRWSIFRYHLQGIRGSAPRTAVWRELQAMGAVTLRNREWAVPHQPRAVRRLDRLVDYVDGAGGRASITEVGIDTAEDVQLRSRARRACEHLWDELLDAADWFERRHPGAPSGAVGATEVAAEFDELRQRYAEVRRRDFVGTAAGRHAAARLRQLAPAVADDRRPTVGRRRRPRVELDAVWSALDGRSTIVTRLYPRPSLAWEQGFRAFEQWVYRPSADRLVLEHGLLCGPVETDQLRPALQAITDRIAAFEQSRP